MSDIAPIGRPNAAQLGQSSRLPRPEQTNAAPSRGSDKVELSATAQLLSKLAELPDVRQDLVDQVRAEIEADIYESPGKIDAAVDNDELAEDLA